MLKQFFGEKLKQRNKAFSYLCCEQSRTTSWPNYCRVTVVSTRTSHFRILVVFRSLIPHFTSAH